MPRWRWLDPANGHDRPGCAAVAVAASSTPVVRHFSVVPFGFLLLVVDRWAFNRRDRCSTVHLRTRAGAVVLVGGRASSSCSLGPAVNRSLPRLLGPSLGGRGGCPPAPGGFSPSAWVGRRGLPLPDSPAGRG